MIMMGCMNLFFFEIDAGILRQLQWKCLQDPVGDLVIELLSKC
jgi:hypothetical protein